MRKFKVLKIDAETGETSLLAGNLRESDAITRSYELEHKEIRKPARVSWYAVTDSENWRDYGPKFIEYRRQLPY